MCSRVLSLLMRLISALVALWIVVASIAALGIGAFDFLHLWPALRLVRAVSWGTVGFVTCLCVALLLSFVAVVASSPAIEGRPLARRGRPHDGDRSGAAVRERLALGAAGGWARLAQALGLSAAAIERAASVGGERRVRGWAVASAERLCRAARDRAGMGSGIGR